MTAIPSLDNALRSDLAIERGASLVTDLTRPSAYPKTRSEEAKSVTIEETATAWVFLVGDDAYKVKKPVDFGFLDFRTLEARQHACHEEVALNRRLAPEVYLGIVPVCRDREGRASIVGTGEVIDCAVHMRRLPADHRADRLLAGGFLTNEMIDHVGSRLARFHANARCDKTTSAFGSEEHLLESIEDSFAHVDLSPTGYLTPEEAEGIVCAQMGFVERHASAFQSRADGGRVRDGHGDLRLDQMYVTNGEAVILDCVEYDERFRYGDVVSDLASLTMDLARLGRSDLAERLLARYARDSDDYGVYVLIDFYEIHRAVLRGRTSASIAERSHGDGAARAMADARSAFLFATSPRRATLLLPAMVVVGGAIGTGKSTIAGALANLMNAPCINADQARRSVVGASASTHVDADTWESAYDPSITRSIYETVLRRADQVLTSGRPVVIDASFRSRTLRTAVRALAERHKVPFRFVECRADNALCHARLVERTKRMDGPDAVVPSGRMSMIDGFLAAFEPVSELAETEHIALDTSVPLEEALGHLKERLASWPPKFVA